MSLSATERGATLLAPLLLIFALFASMSGLTTFLSPARAAMRAVERNSVAVLDLHSRLEAALVDPRLPLPTGRRVGERLYYAAPSGIGLWLEVVVDPLCGDTCWRLIAWSSRAH